LCKLPQKITPHPTAPGYAILEFLPDSYQPEGKLNISKSKEFFLNNDDHLMHLKFEDSK
jgi:hypothetical protein